MRHVDEGRLHAWLDRARSGMAASDAAEIERHFEACAGCRAALDEARILHERADSILAGAGPADREAPAFEVILARGAAGLAASVAAEEAIGEPVGAIGPKGGGGRPGGWRPVWAAAWAASLLFAIGLGWLGRDLMRNEQLALDAVSTEVERVAPARDPAVETRSSGTFAEPTAPIGPVRSAPPTTPTLQAGEPREASADAAAGYAQAGPVPAAPPSAPPPSAPPPLPEFAEAASAARTAPLNDRAMPDPTPAGAGADQPSLPGGGPAEPRALPAIASLPVNVLADRGRASVDAAAEAQDRTAAQAPPAVRTELSATAAPAARALQLTPTPGPLANASWVHASPAEAREQIGTEPVIIPDLVLVAFEVAEMAGVSLVRTVHLLEGGHALTLTQWRLADAAAAAPWSAQPGSATRTLRDLVVTATAPISPEALRALLERAR